MRARRLDRVALNVADLTASVAFYVGALGFTAGLARDVPQLARLLGARAARTVRLRRGGQVLELSQCDPPGAPCPPGGLANDLWFQHCALVTGDMAASYARLRGTASTPISRDGPQPLPGGIVAYKFRDPDGHPLELISFPHPDPRTQGGIDHSAISVADAARSIAFYAERLGLTVAARQVNTGPAQDAMDGLDGVRVDVVALAPAHPAPHVELLGYRTPPGRPALPMHPSDLAASRLVFAVEMATETALLRDPDGHHLMLEQQ
jgi:catechol 2,3-dioxygenase-like lactoylglutathione lyase family enzyme